jgi:beta-lactamase regulating signal transducer with metallopeptidase domain
MRDYFDPEWTEYIFGLLNTAAWQAAVLIAVAFVGSLCARCAIHRCRIWNACVLGLALVPVLSVLLPHVCFGYLDAAEPLHFPSFISRPTARDPNTFWTFSEGFWDDGLCRAAVFVWLGGAGVALMRIALAWIKIVRHLRLATPCEDRRIQAIFRETVPRPTSVTLLQLAGLRSAVCWQVHRPTIVLPAAATDLPDDVLRMIITHEWSHICRSDPGMLFLQRLVEVFYWFHPLVWFVALQNARYREYVCDDRVIAAGHDRTAYARCLAGLAASYSAPMSMVPAALGMLWGQHLVLRRVKRLVQLGGRAEIGSTSGRLIVGGAAFAAILLTALVRFYPVPNGCISTAQWTAWPPWTARALDTLGVRVRDYPLDGHRYDPRRN